MQEHSPYAPKTHNFLFLRLKILLMVEQFAEQDADDVEQIWSEN